MSVSGFVAVGAMIAVLGAVMLLVSISVIIGATKVSDAFTVLSTLLSTLLSYSSKEHIL